MGKIQDFAQDFFEHVLYDEKPLFVSDEATILDVSTSEAAELLSQMVQPGDLVLIKGSRAARTEEVIGHFALCYSLAAPQRREGGPFVTSP